MKTRKSIEEVFEIENSTHFVVYKWLSEVLDPFTRFIYLAIFILFICLKLADLYNLVWLKATVIALFIASSFLYLYLIISQKMHETEWKFKKVIEFYVKLRCLFPKPTVLKTKKEEVKKKSRRD